jgi:2-cysteine adaptor domain
MTDEVMKVPKSYEYSFGYNIPLFYDWIAEYYKIPKMPFSRVSAHETIFLTCNKKKEDQRIVASEDVLKHLKAQFKKHKMFIFPIVRKYIRCDKFVNRDKSDPNLKSLTKDEYDAEIYYICLWVKSLNAFFVIDPKAGFAFNKFKNTLLVLYENKLEKLFAELVKGSEFIRFIPDYEIIKKLNVRSVNHAVLLNYFLLLDAVTTNTFESVDELYNYVQYTYNADRLKEQYLAWYRAETDYETKKCKTKILNTETDKCLSEKQAARFKTLRQDDEDLLRVGFSQQAPEVELDPDFVQTNDNHWMANILINYPLADAVIPNLESDLYTCLWWQRDNKRHEFMWPKRIDQAFVRFLKNGRKRFFVIKVTLGEYNKELKKGEKPVYHANVIIYDKMDNTFELFEPWGWDQMNIGLEIEAYLKKINQHIRQLEKEGKVPKGWKFKNILDFCPVTGYTFQIGDIWPNIRENEGQGYKSGTCGTWAWWYVHTRLKNPGKTREEILSLALEEFKKISGKAVFINRFRNYINNEIFSQFNGDTNDFIDEYNRIQENQPDSYPNLLKDKVKPGSYKITKKQCQSFKRNRSVNPVTGRKIKKGSRTQLKIIASCKKY